MTEGEARWASTPQLVEVEHGEVATLFIPRSNSSSSAMCVRALCADLEITDIALGSCPLQIKLIKRHGPSVALGEITKWEERNETTLTTPFTKGEVAFHASFSKAGSVERRTVVIYTSSDGLNLFQLEWPAGSAIGNNEEISKRYLVLQVEYEAEGFNKVSSGTGSSTHRLFVQPR